MGSEDRQLLILTQFCSSEIWLSFIRKNSDFSILTYDIMKEVEIESLSNITIV